MVNIYKMFWTSSNEMYFQIQFDVSQSEFRILCPLISVSSISFTRTSYIMYVTATFIQNVFSKVNTLQLVDAK
jgi:hypothetical protein